MRQEGSARGLIGSSKRYSAFISYSHSDRAWADWLHKSLERYRLPGRVIESGVDAARLVPVFLDRAELGASSDLEQSIAAALTDSETLIVICSPSAARSPRVSREIEIFRREVSGRILCLLVAGRPNSMLRGGAEAEECFPPPLRKYAMQSPGSSEPLAADVRSGRGARQEALLKLVAGILDVNLDALRQRDLQRRRRLWAACTGVISLGLVIASALAVYAWEQRDVAITAQSRLLIELAAARLKVGDIDAAEKIILEVLTDRRLAQSLEAAALNVFQEARADDAQLAVLAGHSQTVTNAHFSPDGKYVVTSSYDHAAMVWDAASGHLLRQLDGHTNVVWDAQFSPDGKRVVTASNDHTARIWDFAGGKSTVILGAHTDQVRDAVFSPDGQHILTASWDKTARIWDAFDGRQIVQFVGHTERIESAAFSPNAERVVTAAWDNSARVWDASSGRELLRLSGHKDRLESAAFSPDGTRIVTASADKTARIWNAVTGEQILVLAGYTDRLFSAVFSPDGAHILTASYDKTARIWDATTGQQIKVLDGHKDWIRTAAYSPDGRHIVTASNDHTARIWDSTLDSSERVLDPHSTRLFCAQFSPDGLRIVTSSQDATARVWDAGSGQQLRQLTGHTDTVASARYSGDGLHIVTASFDGTARIWDASSGTVLQVLAGNEHLYDAEFSPDGTHVATASTSGEAKIWDVTAGTPLQTLRGNFGELTSAAYSADGSRIVIASGDKTARTWSATSGTQVLVLNGHSSQVWSAAFSSDAGRIVTAAFDKTARIWDAASGQSLVTLSGHGDRLWSAQFSPDGSRIITASNDRTARLWDAATGQQLLVLSGHADPVRSVAFSPDGRSVVTASYDGTARNWNARAAPIESQIQWSKAAQFDSLASTERIDLGLLGSVEVRRWPLDATACDQAAAAIYDPKRRAPGVALDEIAKDIAIPACGENSRSNDSPRLRYQRGRALIAGHDMGRARQELEAALSKGYTPAGVDLAALLSRSDYSDLDLGRAITLYETSWERGLSIAAFELGILYEKGMVQPNGKGSMLLAPDVANSWRWNQRAADAGEPHALARIAQAREAAAVFEDNPDKKTALLLESFQFYAAAVQSAIANDWPDSVWNNWRYRRASLARLLARGGKMQEVAQLYTNVTERHPPSPSSRATWP